MPSRATVTLAVTPQDLEERKRCVRLRRRKLSVERGVDDKCRRCDDERQRGEDEAGDAVH